MTEESCLAGIVAELNDPNGDFSFCVVALADWHEERGETGLAAGLRAMLERGHEPNHNAWFSSSVTWLPPRHEASIVPHGTFCLLGDFYNQEPNRVKLYSTRHGAVVAYARAVVAN